MERKPKVEANILAAIERRAESYKKQVEDNNAILQQLQTLFSKDIDTLTTGDLAEQPLTKLSRIISAIDMIEEDFRDVDLSKDDGRDYLLNQVKQFIQVHRDRIDHALRGIDRCDKYVDFITSKKPKELVDDKDFNNFFKSLGILDSEKVYVNRMLAEKNISMVKVDPELTQTVVYMDSYQKGNEDIKNKLLEVLGDKPRRLEVFRIKDISEQVAQEYGVSVELVQNVLVSMLVEQEYGRYVRTGSRESLKKINSLMPYAHSNDKVMMSEANKIIASHAINSKSDFNRREVVEKVMDSLNVRVPGIENEHKSTINELSSEYRQAGSPVRSEVKGRTR